jgi:hypothetical protein
MNEHKKLCPNSYILDKFLQKFVKGYEKRLFQRTWEVRGFYNELVIEEQFGEPLNN